MSENMDNFKVHVIARSDDALERAVQLAMLDYQAAAWRGDGDTLILLWSAKDGSHALPCNMSAADVMPMIRAWLKAHPPAKDKRPDIDGDTSNGFELVGGRAQDFYDILRVRSIWALHHK
jgi:hypothetical protein